MAEGLALLSAESLGYTIIAHRKKIGATEIDLVGIDRTRRLLIEVKTAPAPGFERVRVASAQRKRLWRAAENWGRDSLYGVRVEVCYVDLTDEACEWHDLAFK